MVSTTIGKVIDRNQGQIVAAMISNFESAEEALKQHNSAGSAEQNLIELWTL